MEAGKTGQPGAPGGEPRKRADPRKRIDNSVAYAIDFWKRRNGCTGDPARSHKGLVTHDAWKCEEGTAVELYAIEGHGHAWPGGEKGSNRGDAPGSEISATDVMWDFFARHPKN